MAEKKGSNTVDKVFDLAKPLADELGLILWDVRFEKEGANWYLRVFIDKEEGINIEDCEAISRPLNTILDETNPISQSYIFEVCSPGIARELKKPEHFERFMGEEIRIRLIRAVDNIKEYVGILKEYTKDIITILDENNTTIEIAPSDCAYIRLNDDDNLFE